MQQLFERGNFVLQYDLVVGYQKQATTAKEVPRTCVVYNMCLAVLDCL